MIIVSPFPYKQIAFPLLFIYTGRVNFESTFCFIHGAHI
uniref:Uncharacterized protein n=1 Tax=Arundo donax TaxID=35708 RepID=A0A0A9C708_ARUDO